MNKKFRVFSLSLAFVMMVSIFAGCSTSTSPPTASSAATAAAVPNVKIGCFYNLSGGGADTGNKAGMCARTMCEKLKSTHRVHTSARSCSFVDLQSRTLQGQEQRCRCAPNYNQV
jgi:hypothetical protein